MSKMLADVLRRVGPELAAWSTKNFPKAEPDDPVLGVIEELGELSHAILKASQGIRGDAEFHRLAAEDAAGDLYIFALDAMIRMSRLDPNNQDVDIFAHPGSPFSMVLDGMCHPEVMLEQLRTLNAMAADLESDGPHYVAKVTTFMIAKCVGDLAGSIADNYAGNKTADSTEDVAEAMASALMILEGYCVVCLDKQADEIIQATWDHVKQRDWAANPTDAHLIAESAMAEAK